MAVIDPSVLQRDETGLLGSIRNTGLRDMSSAAFGADGTRQSFSQMKDAIGAASTIGKVASLAGTATSNSNLAQFGGDISRAASIASDPMGGLVGLGLQKTLGGVPAAVGMSAFNAVRNEQDVGDAVGKSLATAAASKALFSAVPALGLLNGISGVLGGPTVQGVVRDGYNYIADSVEGVDPATSIRTVNADLEDAGWRAPTKPTEKDIDPPTKEEAEAAPKPMTEEEMNSLNMGEGESAPSLSLAGTETNEEGQTVSNDKTIAEADKQMFGDNEDGGGWGGNWGGNWGGMGNNGQGATSDNGGDD